MFTEFNPYDVIKYKLRNGFCRYIGGGSSREVFDLGNGYVIKIAKNKAGIAQNKAEYRISEYDGDYIFARVIQEFNDCESIIMRKAKKVKNISRVYEYFGVDSKEEFNRCYEIRRIKNEYNLVFGDLNRKSSWGIIDGNMVIIDYGFTHKVQKKYYK